jgi:hypothetical protein
MLDRYESLVKPFRMLALRQAAAVHDILPPEKLAFDKMPPLL